MNVVAFNGSPRAGGNTEYLLKTALHEIQQAGIETEYIQVGGQPLRGCTACGHCRETGSGQCVIDDGMNAYIQAMRNADAILIGSPTYFADVTTETKALIDRAGYVLRPLNALARKLGAGITVNRRGGAIHAFDTINHFFLIQQMIVIGSSYWNDGVGGRTGAVEKEDREGTGTARTLGQNIAWALKKLAE